MYIADVAGPFPRSKRGYKYVLVVVAPEKKGVMLEYLRKKSGVYKAVRRNRKLWETQTSEKMVTLRMDRGGENVALEQYLTKKGINVSYIATGASAGAAEAFINVAERTMSANLNTYASMHDCPRPIHLWPEAMTYGTFCNSCTSVDGPSMYERKTGKPPPFSKFLPFGTTVTAHIPKALRTKGQNKGRIARFVGLVGNGDGYKLYDQKTNTFFTSNSVRPFTVSANLRIPVEKTTLEAPQSPLDSGESKVVSTSDEHFLASGGSEDHTRGQQAIDYESNDVSDVDVENEVDLPARPKRESHAPQRFTVGHEEWETVLATQVASAGGPDHVKWPERDQIIVCLTQRVEHARSNLATRAKAVRNFLKARNGAIIATLPEGAVPIDEKQALSGRDAPWWQAAMDEEDGNMLKNKVLEHISEEEERSNVDRKPVRSRRVFELKLRHPSCTKTGPTYRTLPDGRKVRYKCRLVAKGFSQKEGVDYDPNKLYAPTPQMESIRMILAQTLGLGWNLKQFDVTAAFLIPSLPEEEQMLMRLPNGEGLVRLLKCLYGLRQSAHNWNQDINKTLLKFGFQCVDADQGVYVMYDKDGKLKCCMALHVDDLLISAPDAVLEEVGTKLKDEYDMREENADWFLKIKFASRGRKTGNDWQSRNQTMRRPLLRQLDLTQG